MLTYYPSHKLFVWTGQPHPSFTKAGFDWSTAGEKFYTASAYTAYQLYNKADHNAQEAMKLVHYNMQASRAVEPVLPVDNGLYPFQAAGVEHIVHQYKSGAKAHLLIDEQGLGKTSQALQVASRLGYKRLLVICPASLRLNWVREMDRWFDGLSGEAILTGRQKIDGRRSIVISYDLAHMVEMHRFDFIVVDECFPTGTLVETEHGARDVSDVVLGTKDKFVKTIDLIDDKVKFKKITGRFCKVLSNQLLEVKHEFGSLQCTTNHPIWIEEKGWVNAEKISVGDYVRTMRSGFQKTRVGHKKGFYPTVLWKKLFEFSQRFAEQTNSVIIGVYLRVVRHNFFKTKPYEKSKRKTPAVLWKKMLCTLAHVSTGYAQKNTQCGSIQQNFRRAEAVLQISSRKRTRKKIFRTDVKEQPHDTAICPRTGFSCAERNRPQTKNSGWQWSWFNRAAENGITKTARFSNRVYCKSAAGWKRFRFNMSQSLQNRCGGTRAAGGDRNRRFFARVFATKSAGQEKKHDFILSRVESVQIYESGSSGRELVFCLDVEGTSSFLANGVLVHNCHYLKEGSTKRTKLILGTSNKKFGIIDKAPTIFLSGTPAPNGRPTEMWPILFRTAPAIINYMKLWPFTQRYCNFYDDGYSLRITGAKRAGELNIRLRGSGFMTRRLKSEVLKDLPPKRYALIVFPASGEAAAVIEREREFSAQEIIDQGVPVGDALPQLRREMGVAKIPQALEYITNLLAGTQKLVVFCHHVEVAQTLHQKLAAYNPVMIIGATAPTARQAAVDRFQEDSNCRVFIGNSAAQEGITLTKAHDVVLVEGSWVPGENDQRVDRLHRIGQTERVMVHILVVEGSLDAKILGSAAFKQKDINAILK